MKTSIWINQLQRGIAEFCILLFINQKPTYGYEIISNLNKLNYFNITEGTLYTLLRKLQNEKYINSYWKESSSGPPRKYYTLTLTGKSLLKDMNIIWTDISDSINELTNLKE